MGVVDKNEYKTRVRAYTRMVARKTEKSDRSAYREKDMKVGMPWGCWAWIAGFLALAILGFKACFV